MNTHAHVAEHRALVARLFPQIGAFTSFEPVRGGWTCDTYEVDGVWIVQLPREGGADTYLRRQIEVLPEIAAEVSGAVPEPELVSLDPVILGYRKLEGASLFDAGDDGVWPERLGRFLYDLHMIPPEYLGMRVRGAAALREERRGELAKMRERVFPLLGPAEAGAFDDRFDAYLADDDLWRFATCVTHNDLGPEHILVSPTGDLAGVIDWEEVGIGDPAWDFAWLLGVRPDAGERALAAYGGPPDTGFRTRGRFSFLLMPWHEVVHGLDTGQEAFVQRGLEGVRARADA
jgi:aminoglycoside phosphotransferase (APT) family kinase protein